MGKPNSKPEPKPEPAPVVEQDNSSGFHVLEVHAPTAGISVLSMLFIAGIVLLFALVLRRLGRRIRKQNARHRERIARSAWERSLEDIELGVYDAMPTIPPWRQRPVYHPAMRYNRAAGAFYEPGRFTELSAATAAAQPAARAEARGLGAPIPKPTAPQLDPRNERHAADSDTDGEADQCRKFRPTCQWHSDA